MKEIRPGSLVHLLPFRHYERRGQAIRLFLECYTGSTSVLAAEKDVVLYLGTEVCVNKESEKNLAKVRVLHQGRICWCYKHVDEPLSERVKLAL